MKQYIVDAFTEHVFSGNPAAVCIMSKWLPDNLMMQITKENNLSETAFAVPKGDTYLLRWFTPGGEIDLCGHATLATAYVITRFYRPELKVIYFETKSGILSVARYDNLFELDFPAYKLKSVEVTKAMAEAIGAEPVHAYLGRDLLCVFDSEDIVRNLSPNMDKLLTLDGLLLHATAPGKEFDCISRTFAPKLNVYEDPVCGSGHCHILPYWSELLDKDKLVAYQASSRGGTIYGSIKENRVFMSGKAVLYSEAEIYV